MTSSSFIASRYCWSKEVQVALERHKAGTVRVIPIILRPVDWQNSPLGQLQALPTGAKPITQWYDQDAALDDVVRGIRAVVEYLRTTLPQEVQKEEKHSAQKNSREKVPHLGTRSSLLMGGALGLISLLVVLFMIIKPMTTNGSVVQATTPTTTNDLVSQAMEIRACMQQHGLREAHITTKQPDNIKPWITFARCDWPPPAYAGLDGYSEIRVVTVDGPGQSEASGTDLADRITTPCQKLQVSFTRGAMSEYEHLPPFTVNADGLYTQDGMIWQGDRSTLNFFPERGEIVVLHNGKYSLDSAIYV